MKQNGNEASGARKKKPLSPSRMRIERDKLRMVELYLQGNTMEMVTVKIREEGGHGYSISTVSKAVNEAITEWKKGKDELINNHKAVELEKINRVEVAAWEGWHRSLTVINTVKTRKTPVKVGETPPATAESSAADGKKRRRRSKAGETPLNTVEITDEMKRSNGDSRFLVTIQWCIEYRCKLLGSEAPVKVETNSTLTATVNQTITQVRRVVFKTRETTGTPQVLPNPQNN